MKAILIKGVEMPKGDGTFLDVRINSDGSVLVPCAMGECTTASAEEVEA